MERNKDFVPWIVDHYKKGSEVASLCVGAMILAATGLLEGKTCTTHWMVADAFKQMYPNVKLQSDKVLIDESGVYSSGGAYSFLNLILYLIEKYTGRQTAIYVAKVMEIDIDRQSQLPFAIFGGQKVHQDDLVKKAQYYIENNFAERSQ
jgi:transcriptional regulator GlxA family with amidase domain